MSLRPFSPALLLMLPLVAAVPAAAAAGAEGLPDGVAFRLDGRDLPAEAFHEFVGAEYRGAPTARALLESVAQEVIIDLEARRRGLSVAPSELDARIRRLDEQTRRESGGGLDAVLRDQGVSEEEFRLMMRRSLLLEKVVREEFGGEEITDAKATIWLQDRMKRATVATDGLAPHLVARVDGEPVTTAEFGRRLLARHPAGDPERRRMENEYLRVELATRFAGELGVTLRDQDVADALAARERRLRAQPGFADVSLDTFLRKTGSTAAELAARPSFRAQVLLRRVIDEVLYPGPTLYWLYRSHQASFDKTYGRSARIATVFLQAGAGGAAKAGFVRRTFEDAEAELNALRKRFEDGRAQFATVAAARSEHESAKAGGELGWVNEASGDLAALAQAALASESDAEYVGPVRAADGVHLLRVTARRPAPGYAELEEAIRRHAIQLLIDARARRSRVER